MTAEEPLLGNRVQGGRQHHDQDRRGAEGEHWPFPGERVELGTKASTRLLDALCDDSHPATGDSEDQTGNNPALWSQSQPGTAPQPQGRARQAGNCSPQEGSDRIAAERLQPPQTGSIPPATASANG